MVSVVLVDDSAVVRAIIKQFAKKDGRIAIIGEASNGEKAITEVLQKKPDAVIMDVVMPVMNGIEATKIICSKINTAVIIFSTEDSAKTSYDAIANGAIDIIRKPNFANMDTKAVKILFNKIYEVGHAKKNALSIQKKTTSFKIIPPKPCTIDFSKKTFQGLFIGASTGGPQALLSVLKGLKGDFPLPIIITQHIDISFDESLAIWLSENSAIPVSLVKGMTVPKKGCAYLAPANHHLIVKKNTISTNPCFILDLNEDNPIHFLRPAVDKLFSTAATILKDHCIAILLTGMGSDGALGLLDIKNAGGMTIAESKLTAAVYGMPRAALEKGAVLQVLNLQDIPFQVKKIIQEKGTL